MTRRQLQVRRGQRLPPPQPTDEITIPNYPGDPSPPTRTSFWLVLAPVSGIVVMSFAFGFLYKNFVYPIIISTVSLVYPMVMLLRQRDQQKRWEKDRDRVHDAYRSRIAELERQLGDRRGVQKAFLEWTYPGPEQLARWVDSTSDRLWERRPEHSDFMGLRLGVGEIGASYRVKVPTVEIPELASELLLEAREMAQSYQRVAQVPVGFNLAEHGSLGISGPRHLREGVLRTILGNVSVLHAPQDLSIFAVLPSRGISEWNWMKWLPHCQVLQGNGSHFQLGYEPERTAQLLSGVFEELAARAIRRSKDTESSQADLPYLLLVIADDQAVRGEVAVQRVLSDGQQLRAGLIVLTNSPKDLPHGCKARFEIKNETEAFFFNGDGSEPVRVIPDLSTAGYAERLARGLAPLELGDAQLSGGLPDQIRLMELLGMASLDPLELQGQWLAALSRPPTLKVPIGMRQGRRPLVLDLQQSGHGPHGLIAGTTGSGKSELLLTLLAALALANHPHQVNLVLVDYKGGTAMSVLADLPHTVGVVTDLDGKQTRRALVALRSELARREEILARHQVADIDKYHELGIPGPFPYLFIVIDEFAELKEKFKYDLGEVLNEFVSIAQKGRALGVHLILAMQRPEGVVNESIRANMRFRICLRVERAEDSRSVLGRPDAFLLPSQPPGRAYFQVGKDEQFDLFQVARVAGFYRQDNGASEQTGPLLIQEVAPDGRRFPLLEIERRLEDRKEAEASPRTEAQILVEKAAEAASRMGMERLPSPWPPPLPDAIPLEALYEMSAQPSWVGETWPADGSPNGPSPAVPVGLLDEPANQRQVPLLIDMSKAGNVLVIGSPGSGRTNFLLTLCTSLARAYRPDLFHFHLIDFAGHQLRAALSEFPHVAGVYGPESGDRIHRLLASLSAELESRRSQFESAGATNLDGYRMQQSGRENLPAILTVFNNLSGFQEQFADEISGWIRLFREGGAYGLYFALTSDRFPPGKIADLIQTRIALRIADRTMYSLILDARPDLTTFTPVPGRGFFSSKPPLEVQIALPTRGPPDRQIQALQEIGGWMSDSWSGPRPEPVRILEEKVSLAQVLRERPRPAQPEGREVSAWIGLEAADLRPVEVNLSNIGSYFLICGPPESGKTTALATLALAVAALHSPGAAKFALITPNRNERLRLDALLKLPHALGQAKTESSMGQLLSRLAKDAEARLGPEAEPESRHGHMLLLVDDYHLLSGRYSGEALDQLAELASTGTDSRITAVVTLPSTVLGTLNDPFIRQARAWRAGIWLQSTDSMESSLVGLRIPAQLRGKELPPGRGFLFDPGGQLMFQLASPEVGESKESSEPSSVAGWVDHILGRAGHDSGDLTLR